MTTERDLLLEKLEEISIGNKRSKIERLREIFDGIEAARAKHTPNKTIVVGLEELGLIYDVNTFKNACSRIRKERTLAALAQAAYASRNTSAANTTEKHAAQFEIPEGSKGTDRTAGSSAQPGSRKQQDKAHEKTQIESKPVGGSRPSILSSSKGAFAGLKPDPAE